MFDRSFVVGAFSVVLSLPLACCFASDFDAEPMLGVAEPIGALVLTQSPAEVPRELEPDLGTPILLAALEISDEPADLPDPDEIQRHLKSSLQMLESAGLSEQAAAIDAVLREFRDQHHGRLLLKKKRADLARLQSEIEQLALQFDSQVVIRLQFFQADRTQINDIPEECQTEKFGEWLKAQQQEKNLIMLSVPTLRAASGTAAEVQFGSTDHSTRVVATSTVMDTDRICICVQPQLTRRDKNSEVLTQRFQATFEMKVGRTQVLALGKSADQDGNELLMAASLLGIETEESRPAQQSSEEPEAVVTPVDFQFPSPVLED